MFFFFFSSRRRHTRWPRDWSSDVCSSDLPDAEGLLVREVTQGGPAARAGLAQGDLIVAAGGRPVRAIDDLFDALEAAPGGTVERNVVRGAEERPIQVVFESGQPEEEA